MAWPCTSGLRSLLNWGLSYALTRVTGWASVVASDVVAGQHSLHSSVLEPLQGLLERIFREPVTQGSRAELQCSLRSRPGSHMPDSRSSIDHVDRPRVEGDRTNMWTAESKDS